MTDELPPSSQRSARDRWLSRLSFSFVIIAAFLMWQAFHVAPDVEGAGWRRALYLLSAAMAMALGVAGIRARHRMLRE
jgi:hypothetical protein